MEVCVGGVQSNPTTRGRSAGVLLEKESASPWKKRAQLGVPRRQMHCGGRVTPPTAIVSSGLVVHFQSSSLFETCFQLT